MVAMNKNYWQSDAHSFMQQLTYGYVRLMPSCEMARGGVSDDLEGAMLNW